MILCSTRARVATLSAHLSLLILSRSFRMLAQVRLVDAIEEDALQPGLWIGTCLCGSGHMYMVGSEGAPGASAAERQVTCGRLACEHGVASSCRTSGAGHERDSRRRVRCAQPAGTEARYDEILNPTEASRRYSGGSPVVRSTSSTVPEMHAPAPPKRTSVSASALSHPLVASPWLHTRMGCTPAPHTPTGSICLCPCPYSHEHISIFLCVHTIPQLRCGYADEYRALPRRSKARC